MEQGAHPFEGAELPEADLPQDLPHLGEVVGQVGDLVGVGAQGQDPAPQLVVQLQDGLRGGRSCKP